MSKEKFEKAEKMEKTKLIPKDMFKKQREALSQQPLDQAKENTEWLKEKYDLEIEFIEKEEQREDGAMEVTKVDEGKKIEILKQIRKEIIKIPPKIFKKLNIKKIILCETLRHNGEPMAGSTNMSDKDARIYIAEMFCFFHEIFHQVDYSNEEAFNSMDFFKGPKKREKARKALKKNLDWGKLDTNWKEKSQSAPYYDDEQCDYFSYLLNLDKGQDWYKDNLVFVHRDSPINDEKEREMKKLIYEWSEGLMDYRYWIDLEAGKVDENYWEKREKGQ